MEAVGHKLWVTGMAVAMCDLSVPYSLYPREEANGSDFKHCYCPSLSNRLIHLIPFITWMIFFQSYSW